MAKEILVLPIILLLSSCGPYTRDWTVEVTECPINGVSNVIVYDCPNSQEPIMDSSENVLIVYGCLKATNICSVEYHISKDNQL